MLRLVLLWTFLLELSYGEVVTFPSGESYAPVNPENLGDEANDYDDPLGTGSLLFDSTGIDNDRLSLNIRVSSWKSPSMRYFRAHPDVIKCLQMTYTCLSSQRIRLSIADGYRTGADYQTNQLKTGSAAVLRLREGSVGAVENVAKATIQQCVQVFQESGRDFAVTLYRDKVELALKADDGNHGLRFTADDNATMDGPAFSAQAWDWIDAVYDPVSVPTCTDTPSLNPGESFPSDTTAAEDVVGAIDNIVTRDSADFITRLVQYPARHIEFADEERASAWCGAENTSCPDCTSHPEGLTAEARCADRVMSKRLLTALKKVEKLVRNQWNGVRLKVLEAWDEAHAASPSGDQPAGSLHYEGRAARLQLSDGQDDKLLLLSTFCICAGLDYVHSNDDHLYVAVKKQAGDSPAFVQYPSAALLIVEPPLDDQRFYAVNKAYSGLAVPLVDSGGQEQSKLCDDATIEDFKDPNKRYFRLSPVLVDCYQRISTRENKWNSEANPSKTFRKVVVRKGYQNTLAQNNEYDVMDLRYSTHNLGIAMELTYDPAGDDIDPDVHTPARLARWAAIKCGPLFINAGYEIGIGLYGSSVYIALRDKTDRALWVAHPGYLPPNTAECDWHLDMETRIANSVEGRIIEPDSLSHACLTADPPQKQSLDFDRAVNSRQRSKRSTVDEVCVPASDTTHCSRTAVHREAEVAHIMEMVTQKHLHPGLKNQLHAALEGCLGVCGTCVQGELWDSKVEHCDNFLHWVNFELDNDEPNVTNLFYKENSELKMYACGGDRHCLVEAPLFSLMIQAVEERFRPDPAQSVEQLLYPVGSNPVPVLKLLSQLYAIHASGKVTVWVKDKAEMQTLKTPVKVVLLYNKEVSDVIIHVEEQASLDDVSGLVESWVRQWTTSSCPDVTRNYVTPFTIDGMPTERRKRSPEHELRESLLERDRTWEKRWLDSRNSMM
ncbi:IHH [Branchiostoma lanceolatum]|uniref:IHH protein n=1 Tax=Branchiostoma lanceolatum TaxID=7740 RepID=A0A8K0EA68_BRALA|nr:IHH [Branchiostoma lanceolatum]